MEGSLADKLYSESVQLSKIQLDLTSSANNDGKFEFWDEGGSVWDCSDDELDKASDLDREWNRRRDQFHMMGYRDGLIAGKEASSQVGFNIGFKQSVLVEYNWGLVRGVTSALAGLPDGLGEKLIKTEEQRAGFQDLYESVCCLSTTDSLRLFNDNITDKKPGKQSKNSKTSILKREAGLQQQTSNHIGLQNYFSELRSLLLDSPGIKVRLP
ncbi:hypothetical protein M0R45_015866 [Rubus argutus]|uniref:Essential protein Yae1 N-terminal domain-containing protein n=1 Tax=Rubus argutus TaxID=59490 RepID=A0AAW1XRG3_RUBAR